MFYSSEVRWFFEGKPDPAIVDWFAASRFGRQEDPRADKYLLLPGCTSTGVKIREERLEIKAQTGPRELVQYDNGLRGYRESWVKWSRKLDGADDVLCDSNDLWISVSKRRILRLYAIDGTKAGEVPAGEIIDGPGCQLELACLAVDAPTSVRADNWWTICLEAFGVPDQNIATLSVTAAQEPLSEIAQVLTLDASMSYPFWLSRLIQN